MNLYPFDGFDKPNYKTLIRITALLFVASLMATCIPAFTNLWEWTQIPLWVLPALAVGVPAYGWALYEWLQWGERRRARGHSAHFGLRWHVGATTCSDLLVIGTVVAALACLIGGAFSDHLSNFGVLLWMTPALWAFMPLFGTKGQTAIPAWLVGVIGFGLLNSAPAEARRHGLDAATAESALLFFVAGACLLLLMVWWHAHGAWLAEQPTESKAT